MACSSRFARSSAKSNRSECNLALDGLRKISIKKPGATCRAGLGFPTFFLNYGAFTVTGTYTLAPPDPGGTGVTQSFTASLVTNDTVVQLLSIAGS